MNKSEQILNLVNDMSGAMEILNNQPKFILEALDQEETFFNLRTKKYIERSTQSALIQLDDEEYFHTTMPYSSSFYSECIKLCDLQQAISEKTS